MFAFHRRPVPSRARRRVLLRFETFEERTVPAVAVGVNLNSTQTDQTVPMGNGGAVGPNHYVHFVGAPPFNGQFTVYAKNGSATPVAQVTDTAFWLAAGIPQTVLNDLTTQPRVVYDPLSDRWFAACVTIRSTGNLVLLARSDTNNPAGAWDAISYNATNHSGTGTNLFGNFPALGVDKNGVYVGTANFTQGGVGGGLTDGSTLTSIPKASLLQATPTLTGLTQRTQRGTWPFLFEVTQGWAPQVVTNFDPNDDTATVVTTTTFTPSVITYWDITWDGAGNDAFGNPADLGIPSNPVPGMARQPNGSRLVSGGDDDRYSGAAFQVGDLIYAIHPISVDGNGNGAAAGTGTTDALQLVVLRDSTNSVVTTKTFFNPNYDYTYPSLAANAFGDIVIGFNRSGGATAANGNLGAYAIHARINPANPSAGVTELETVELQAGLFNAYNLTGQATLEPWGPYSSTTVDPTDPFAFWTTQQYANKNLANESMWSTKVSQVLVSPRALTVSSSTPNGTYQAPTQIPINISFNGSVTVTGTPRLVLNSGGTAVYTGGSGTSTLTFTYTVGAGDSATDLDYTAAGIDLNGGTINHVVTGGFGVPAELTLPAPGTAGSLGANKNLVITPSQPAASVTGVTSPTANDTYGPSDVISISVGFNRDVLVSGTPQLALNSGGTATYTGGSGSSTLTFTYTVAAGHNSADLDYTSAVALTGGTITDEANGSPASLTLPAPGAAGSLGVNKDIVIDTVAPQVTAVSSPDPDGTYGPGQVITITVAFDEEVTVSGTPQLALNSGGTATYASGSGESTLRFTYTVATGQSSPDLDYTSTGALTGGTIADEQTGQAATLTLPAPGTAGSLGANKAIVVQQPPAAVTNVTSPTANGTYGTGRDIDITVQFDRAVTVTGSPQLALNTGGTATFQGASGPTLTFRYTVLSGHNAADLDYASTGALTGGTITDAQTGQPVNRTLPAPGTGGSLGANKALLIDTVGPSVLEFRVLYGSKKYNLVGAPRTALPWLVKGIQVVFSEPVTAGNFRSLTGLTATRLSGLRTRTLTWNFAGLSNARITASLAATGLNALKDSSGNPIAGFTQAFTVLYGDFDGNGRVEAADEAGIRNNMALPYQINPSGYNVFGDLSGDGLVNLVDVGITRTRRGAVLN